ncbi:MAG TPA: D-alanyl-D-alanine endopeptidase [Steroidobacteraceae bacterium]|nr:D-alanyl-D-alanine endopeptidase [Steroidobacteraceae bacterium]
MKNVFVGLMLMSLLAASVAGAADPKTSTKAVVKAPAKMPARTKAKAIEKADAGPGLKSNVALITDAKSGEVLYERKPGAVTPIASITKLMTALVVLDAQQDLDEVIEITSADRWTGKGAFSRIPIGAKISRGDLLKLALMASENRASHALGRNYPGGLGEFVKTMNLKAKVLGMTQTKFNDPSGLSNDNVSSARDLVKLVNAASREVVIREDSTLESHEVRLGKRGSLVYRNTNLLVGKTDWEILVQKTGFTNDAGECLVMKTLIGEREVNMVFLDSFGKLTRTAEARRVRKWMETNDQPKVTAGAVAGAE